ncbi:MAG: redoxin domain-containing protein [Cyclobacteriaceae bacterium]|nr:redoxin domain-containing protein [Cyclobacteriaceae bacterium]
MREKFYSLLFIGWAFISPSAYSQKIVQKECPKVILFFGLECPICLKYVPELNLIYQEYSSRVEFEVVIPEKSEAKSIREFISEYNVTFPITKNKHRLTRSLNPGVTPEVFLLDSKGKLVYQGAIDNWFYELGKYRSEPTEFYLRNALDSTLTGTVPRIEKTEAIGCVISTNLKHSH